MPSDPTAEQAEIRRKGRQRLVGAVVLALLAVVFVPMALDPEPRRDRPEPAFAIPPKDALPLAAAPAPSAAIPSPTPPESAPTDAKPAEAKPTAAPKADAAVPAAAPAPPPARAEVKAVEPKAAEFKPAPKPGPAAEPATPKLEGFAVQLGAFREDAKLQQARDRLKAARIPHYTERIEAKGGALTRLRAGPFPTREAAEKAAAAMKKAGSEGQVVSLP